MMEEFFARGCHFKLVDEERRLYKCVNCGKELELSHTQEEMEKAFFRMKAQAINIVLEKMVENVDEKIRDILNAHLEEPVLSEEDAGKAIKDIEEMMEG